MITSAFILLGGLLLAFVNTLLPTFGGLPSSFLSTANQLNTYISPIGLIFPLDTLLTIIQFVLIFELSLLTFKIALFIFSFMPFFRVPILKDNGISDLDMTNDGYTINMRK